MRDGLAGAGVVALVGAVLLVPPGRLAEADGPAPVASDRVRVPAGPFTRGADSGGEADERPARLVVLREYLIDRLEVANGDYHRCVAAGVCREPRHFGPDYERPRQPVVGVSWFDAGTYCRWAGGRLPTEAEWEKAARGTDGRRYPWGNEPEPDEAHATFGSMHHGPTDVGTTPAGAGPYGTLDQAGNVWEWVQDVYGPTYYQDGPSTDPSGPSCEEAVRAYDRLRARGLDGFTGTNPIPTTCERVLRGGAWNYGGPGLRSSNRVHHAPTFHIRFSGFRCAADGSLVQ
jgi:formylglycine-generating enzyme required for sulfatase activity